MPKQTVVVAETQSSDDDEEYEVEFILASRLTPSGRKYLVKWKNWPDDQVFIKLINLLNFLFLKELVGTGREHQRQGAHRAVRAAAPGLDPAHAAELEILSSLNTIQNCHCHYYPALEYLFFKK